MAPPANQPCDHHSRAPSIRPLERENLYSTQIKFRKDPNQVPCCFLQKQTLGCSTNKFGQATSHKVKVWLYTCTPA
eukprot:5766167-Amphidinium_carterae.1